MLDSFRTRTKVSSALKLLAEERRILLSGRLSDLSRLDSQRTRIVEALAGEKAGLSMQDVEKIRREALRNQNLIMAGMEGIRSAQALLSEQREASESMGIYTDSGQRLTSSGARELNPRDIGSEQF